MLQLFGHLTALHITLSKFICLWRTVSPDIRLHKALNGLLHMNQ